MLESRPDYDDLIEAGIIRDSGVAPSLIGVQAKLQRQMTANQINALLESRPDVAELIHQNIMEDPTRVSGSIQGRQKELEKRMLANHLENALQSRPNPQEITNSTIFEEADDDWQEAYIHNKTVLEGFRAARRESWGLQDFAATFEQMDNFTNASNEQQMDNSVYRQRGGLGIQLDMSQPPREIPSHKWSDVYKPKKDDDVYVVDPNDQEQYSTDGTDSYLDYDMEDEEADHYARLLEAEMWRERQQQQQQPQQESPYADSEEEEEAAAQMAAYEAMLEEEVYAEQLAEQQQAQQDNNDGDDGRTLIRRYGIALKGTAMLYRNQLIDSVHKAALKELILRGDKRVLAAVEVYEADHDDDEILDTLTRIARRGVQEMMGASGAY